jgi:hypothetical protein
MADNAQRPYQWYRRDAYQLRSGTQEEFEQQRGDPGQYRSHRRPPFALVRAPQPGAVEPGAPPFRNPLKFIEVLRAPFNLTAAAAAILVLPKVDQQRTFLSIRNSSTSAGILFIGLGFAPQDASTALFELATGGTLLFDVAVPQDEVWLFSTAGSLGMVGYSLAGTRMFYGVDKALGGATADVPPPSSVAPPVVVSKAPSGMRWG